MDNIEFYSDASRFFQNQFDSKRLADQLEKTRLRTQLNDDDIEFIQSSEFFFLATVDKEGKPDCSIKGGNAGFVSVKNPSTISVPNYDGNGMFRSLGNIMENPWVGMLFVSFSEEQRKLRVNGKATLLGSAKAKNPEDIYMEVEIFQIFPNCPRYLPDIDQKLSSIYNPAKGYDPPDPHWKSKPDLCDHLPQGRYDRALDSEKNGDV